MSFDDILLALIVLKARTGYELKKWLDVEGVFIRANSDQAQIYRTLGRLVRAGHVRFHTERRAGPAAKVYSATEGGVDHIDEQLAAPYQPPARWQEADFGARLLFMTLLRPQGVLELLETELAFRQEQQVFFRSLPRVHEIDRERVAVDDVLVGRVLTDLDQEGRARTDAWLATLERRIAEWSPMLRDARPPVISVAQPSHS